MFTQCLPPFVVVVGVYCCLMCAGNTMFAPICRPCRVHCHLMSAVNKIPICCRVQVMFTQCLPPFVVVVGVYCCFICAGNTMLAPICCRCGCLLLPKVCWKHNACPHSLSLWVSIVALYVLETQCWPPFVVVVGVYCCLKCAGNTMLSPIRCRCGCLLLPKVCRKYYAVPHL